MTDKTPDLPCRDIVEVVTSYLEGDLDPGVRDRFDAHLGVCPDCVMYVDQMRTTIALVGQAVEPEALPAELRDGLRRAFLDWSAGGAVPGSG